MLLFKGNKEKLDEKKIKSLEEHVKNMSLTKREAYEEKIRALNNGVNIKDIEDAEEKEKLTEIEIIEGKKEKILSYMPTDEMISRSGSTKHEMSEACILDYNCNRITGVRHGDCYIMACRDFPYRREEKKGESVGDCIERLKDSLQAKYVLLKEVWILTEFLCPGSIIRIGSSLELYEL